MDKLKGNAAGYRPPVIDLSELRDQHCKVYAPKSVKKAVQDFANREGLTFSEAGMYLWLISFKDDIVFGGYKLSKESFDHENKND